jgi:hypothetical protein
MAQFSITYDIVTEESAEHGDYVDYGFIDTNLTLRDAIKLVFQTRTNAVDGVTSIECDSCPAVNPRWVTVTNGMEFETGDYESRSLHMPDSLSPATRRRIAKLMGAYGT